MITEGLWSSWMLSLGLDAGYMYVLTLRKQLVQLRLKFFMTAVAVQLLSHV